MYRTYFTHARFTKPNNGHEIRDKRREKNSIKCKACSSASNEKKKNEKKNPSAESDGRAPYSTAQHRSIISEHDKGNAARLINEGSLPRSFPLPPARRSRYHPYIGYLLASAARRRMGRSQQLCLTLRQSSSSSANRTA